MKVNKIILISGIVVIAGIVLTGIGYVFGGRVYGISLGGNGLVVNSGDKNNSHEMINIKEDLSDYTKMDLNLSFTDLEVVESDHFGIEASVLKEFPITYSVENGCLSLTQKKGGSFQVVSLGIVGSSMENHNSYVKLYVPKGTEFEKVDIVNDCGDVELGNMTTDDMNIKTSFGKVLGQNIICKESVLSLDSGDVSIDKIMGNNSEISTSFGKIVLDNVKMEKTLTCDADSGDVNITNVIADTMKITASFGKLTVDDMTVNSIKADLDSGDCTIKRFSGDIVDVVCRFGETKLGLTDNTESYAYDIKTDFGEISIDGEEMGEKYITKNSDSEKSITVDGDSCDVTIDKK